MATSDVAKERDAESSTGITQEQHRTNFLEAIMHLFKGAMGVGLFAMGEAFKNGGIFVAPVITLLMGVVCVHCQHVLLSCAEIVSAQHYEYEKRIEYPEAVELCFVYGPARLARISVFVRRSCHFFIFVTQLGFCCIYLGFIATHLHQILMENEIFIELYVLLVIIWIPIWIACLITNLKALAPVSSLANFFLLSSFFIAIYFALKDGLPSISERKPYTNFNQFVLFFGTVVFSYEGIALILPIKNAMKEPRDFNKLFGVLNLGMFLVVCLYMLCGICGYMKWGEEVGDTITWNIGESILAQCTKAAVSLGIMLTYPLQFFVPCSTLIPTVLTKFKCHKYSLLCELIFRTLLSLSTLIFAEAFPNIGLFISLIGGFCSTVLALGFPPIMECLLLQSTIQNAKWLKYLKYFKNFIILIIAFLSFTVGTYISITEIVKYYQAYGGAQIYNETLHKP